MLICAPHAPASLFTAILAGVMITGVSVSVTAIVKVHTELPTALVAVAVIVCIPTVKKLPEVTAFPFSVYTIVEAGIAVVSVAAKFTLVPHWPAVAVTATLAGHTITGGKPVTVTVKEQVAVKPAASVAV